jgi:hypothetical protein
MLHRLASFAAVAALATAPALAQTPPAAPIDAFSTADLAALCRVQPSTPRGIASLAWCHGYIDAAGDYHAALQAGSNRPSPIYCLPSPPPTVAQVAAAFAAWAQTNTQYATAPSIEGLARFAAATYPCPTPAASRRR